jgi:hypothetical protein
MSRIQHKVAKWPIILKEWQQFFSIAKSALKIMPNLSTKLEIIIDTAIRIKKLYSTKYRAKEKEQ